MYDDTECGETLGGFEGWVNSSMISKEKIDYVTKHNLQLDCMWMIEVEEEWKVGSLKYKYKTTLITLSLSTLSKITFHVSDPINFREREAEF